MQQKNLFRLIFLIAMFFLGNIQGATQSIAYAGYTGQLIEELFGNQDNLKASKSLDIEKIRSLCIAGANVNITNEHGLTLFTSVIITDRIALKKKEQIIQIMLSNAKFCKNYLEHKDKYGKTVFWHAAEREYIDMMFLLERNGAVTDLPVLCKDPDGKDVEMSPFQYACCYNLKETKMFYIHRLQKCLAGLYLLEERRSPIEGLRAVISWETLPSSDSASPCSPIPRVCSNT